jgi:GntR family galactonate operon transcriptional repressor
MATATASPPHWSRPRRTIEPAAARLAAMRATPADLARIHEAWQRMAKHDHTERAAFIEADIDFHTALLVASHNIIFIQLAGVVRSAMSSLFDTTETVGSNPPEALALHLAVVEAVRLRQPEDAVRAMSTDSRHGRTRPAPCRDG